MTDREPTGAEIDERRWMGEDSWADQHMDCRPWYIVIGAGCLSYIIVFVIGIVIGHNLW